MSATLDIPYTEESGSTLYDSQSKIQNPESKIDSSPLVLALCFVLALLPFAANFVTFHPDERHYVDGASQMLTSGDYLTPRTPDGYLRFNKPVLTYWLLAAWYHVLGNTPLAGRLSFLILSACIVLMTHRTALLLYGDRRTALIAAAMMATHAPLLSVAVNSIPEVPLTLCWLVCAFGLMGIVVLGRREALYYWAAYGGAGLGIAVKGMPILILVAYAVGFALANPWRWTTLRELVHWPSMIAGAAIGGWWYIAMFALHGNESLAMFVSDQVTERIGLSPLRFIGNLGLVVLCYGLAFVPWNLPLLISPACRVGSETNDECRNPNAERMTNDEFRMRDALCHSSFGIRHSFVIWASSFVIPPKVPPGRQDLLERRMTLVFIAGWAMVMAVVIACVERFAVRYVLAVTPLIAIVLAERLAAIDTTWIEHWWRRSGYVLAGAIGLVAAAMIVIRTQLCDGVALSAGGALIASAGVGLCLLRGSWISDPFLRLTTGALTLFPLSYLALEPIALPDSGEVMALQLNERAWLREAEFAYVGSPALASKARLRIDGPMRLIALSDPEDLAVPDYDALLLRSDDLTYLPSEDYVVAGQFETGLGKIDPADSLRACAAGKLRDYLDQRRRRYVFVVRPDSVAKIESRAGVTFR